MAAKKYQIYGQREIFRNAHSFAVATGPAATATASDVPEADSELLLSLVARCALFDETAPPP
jgi:hypothetical protein